MKRYALTVFFAILVPLSFYPAIGESDGTYIQKKENKFQDVVITWIDRCIIQGHTSAVRIIDYTMNKDPEKMEQFEIEVWSDSENRIINYTVTETGGNTGVFEATVFFRTIDDILGYRVQAFAGDVVFAKHMANSAAYGVATKGDSSSHNVPIVAKIPILNDTRHGKSSDITYGPCTMSYLEKIKDISTATQNYEMLFPAPLKQIQSGLHADEVVCKDPLLLVARDGDSSACVKPETKQKLIERGWIKDTSNIHIVIYSPVLFDGTGTDLQEEELIEHLKDKRDYLDAVIDEVGAKGLYPIIGMSLTMGDNAYSVDGKYAGSPTALDIRVLKEKFDKKTLEEIHLFVRQHVGDDIDVVFSKGSYAVPTPMASTSEANPRHDTQYPGFPTVDLLPPEDRLQVRNQAGYTIIQITLSSWDQYKEWENRRGPGSIPMPPILITENTIEPIVFDMLYEMWQFEDYEISENNPKLHRKTIQKDYLVENHHGIHDWLESEYKKQFGNSDSGFSNYFEFRDHIYRVSMLVID